MGGRGQAQGDSGKVLQAAWVPGGTSALRRCSGAAPLADHRGSGHGLGPCGKGVGGQLQRAATLNGYSVFCSLCTQRQGWVKGSKTRAPGSRQGDLGCGVLCYACAPHRLPLTAPAPLAQTEAAARRRPRAAPQSPPEVRVGVGRHGSAPGMLPGCRPGAGLSAAGAAAARARRRRARCAVRGARPTGL